MAPLPDYVAGTITLTNGSVNFTGTGTGWLAAGFREGDTILGIEDNPGVTYVVESVTDNDSGTLTQPWDGPTGTYTYRMRYLSDGQRVTAQARQLIELLGNGNLQAIAGLDGSGGDKVPYFSGPGSMATADFTPWARSMLSLPGAADRIPYLTGTNSAALTTLTSYARARMADANPEQEKSALGLSATSFAQFATLLLQDTQSTGLRVIRDGSPTNRSIEIGTTSGSVFIGYGASGRLAIKGDANLMSSPWFEVSSDGPLIGGVKMIDGGVTSSGRYARFSNGLQICTNPDLGTVDTQQALGTVFISSTTLNWSFPAVFSVAPTVFGSVSASTRWGTTSNVVTTGCGVRAIGAISSAATSTLGAVAIGRWF